MKHQNTPRLYAQDEHGSTVVLQMRQNRHYKERFLTMFTPTMAKISKLERPAGYHRALLWYLTTLDPQQFRRISAPELCRGAGLAIATANRAITMLIADNVIFADGLTGARALRLNNRLAWTSTAEKHNGISPDEDIQDGRKR